MTDIAEIDRRMEAWRTFLQPHFDRMALPQEKQDAHYASLRQGIPEAMAKESRGEAWWQIANDKQKRLENVNSQHLDQQDADIISKAIRGVMNAPGKTVMDVVTNNYKILKLSATEGLKWVSAIYTKPACYQCQSSESVLLSVDSLMAAMRLGVYPLAHVLHPPYGEDYQCPGPRFMLNQVEDKEKYLKFMAGVQEKMAKYQAEAAAKLTGNL